MGWQDLWHDPKTVARWEKMPPVPQVVEMADLLASEDRTRVLDIGCGLGRHTVYLAARGFEVTATDSAPAAISACTQNLAEAGLSADVVQTDMMDLPFPDAHFDGAVASHVIHHTDAATLERVVELIAQKLAPAGLFVWVTPSSRDYRCGHGCCVEPGTYIDDEHPEGPIPHHYCSQEEVRQLLHAYDILSMHEGESGEGEERKFHWGVLARKTMTGKHEPR